MNEHELRLYAEFGKKVRDTFEDQELYTENIMDAIESHLIVLKNELVKSE